MTVRRVESIDSDSPPPPTAPSLPPSHTSIEEYFYENFTSTRPGGEVTVFLGSMVIIKKCAPVGFMVMRDIISVTRKVQE